MKTGVAIVAFALFSGAVVSAQDLRLPERSAPRWLEIAELTGEVSVSVDEAAPLRAQVQQRIAAVGDRVITGAASSAVLRFDTDIGQIRLSDNTIIEVTTLATTPSGGQITHLAVPQGTASLQIRRFNNATSALEVETPAGVAAVRGTEFGVGISESGKTAVATTEGAVATTAAGETVLVSSGFYTTVIPGEPPAPPRSLADSNLWLEVEPLQPTADGVIISGRVFPANAVVVGSQSLEVDAEGYFSDTVMSNTASPADSLSLTVRSPLGDEARYEIPLLIDGWQSYRQERYSEAEAVFSRRLSDNSRDWDALLGLGYVAYTTGELDMASEYFEQVRSAVPRSAAALAGLGLVAEAQGDRDAAIALWQEALVIDANNVTIRSYLETPTP